MPTKNIDLWPKSIQALPKELSPVAILRQQASLLGQKTRNLVEGQVETRTADFQRFLHHSFYLIAPALDFYKYPLFEVEHLATYWYPLTITMLPLDARTPDEQVKKIEIDSEEKFMEELKNIFADEETVGVIQKLIAQSQQ
ncbi:MAG: hypothetical protein L0229_03810 [Blastocatellia bacterium]|nr:hypothetical protein [Blastocatellia bacterium]